MLPPAGVGFCGAAVSMMVAVGCVAVPASTAWSLTALPRMTSALAVVDSVGVTGVTVKHSPALESFEPGMLFAASPENSARQQYRPAEVTHALGESTVTGYDAPLRLVGPMWVPPVSHVPESFLQSQKSTEPPGVALPPVTLTSAE